MNNINNSRVAEGLYLAVAYIQTVIVLFWLFGVPWLRNCMMPLCHHCAICLTAIWKNSSAQPNKWCIFGGRENEFMHCFVSYDPILTILVSQSLSRCVLNTHCIVLAKICNMRANRGQNLMETSSDQNATNCNHINC